MVLTHWQITCIVLSQQQAVTKTNCKRKIKLLQTLVTSCLGAFPSNEIARCLLSHGQACLLSHSKEPPFKYIKNKPAIQESIFNQSKDQKTLTNKKSEFSVTFASMPNYTPYSCSQFRSHHQYLPAENSTVIPSFLVALFGCIDLVKNKPFLQSSVKIIRGLIST